MTDDEMMAAMADAVAEYVTRATAPLRESIAALCTERPPPEAAADVVTALAARVDAVELRPDDVQKFVTAVTARLLA